MRVLPKNNNNSFFSSSFWIHVKVYIVPFWEHCGGVGMGVNYLFQNTRSFLLFNQISPWLFCTGTQEEGNAVEVAGKTAVSDTARPPPWRIINGRRLQKATKQHFPTQHSHISTKIVSLLDTWVVSTFKRAREFNMLLILPNIKRAPSPRETSTPC